MEMSHLAKIIVLGDSGVGKTSILNRFTNHGFSKNPHPTLGVEFFVRTLHTTTRAYKLQFWDASGVERFQCARTPHFLGATLFIIVFDVHNAESFQNVTTWLDEIKWKCVNEESGQCATEYSQNGLCYLVGSKMDMEHLRTVSREEAQAFADNHDMQYYEMSAKTGDGVETGFNDMIAYLERMDADLRKHEGVGITRVLDFALSNDYEETDTWIDYHDDGWNVVRGAFCCCCFARPSYV